MGFLIELQVLIHMDQYSNALGELTQLVEMAPKEGSVHFMLGKVCFRFHVSALETVHFDSLMQSYLQVYKRVGDHSKAMVSLTRALDLSPKDAQQIKAFIQNLEKEDSAEEDEEL